MDNDSTLELTSFVADFVSWCFQHYCCVVARILVSDSVLCPTLWGRDLVLLLFPILGMEPRPNACLLGTMPLGCNTPSPRVLLLWCLEISWKKPLKECEPFIQLRNPRASCLDNLSLGGVFCCCLLWQNLTLQYRVISTCLLHAELPGAANPSQLCTVCFVPSLSSIFSL